MERWLKGQLNEAHKVLDLMGVPDREDRIDPRNGQKKPFSLGVPERLKWLRRNWKPIAETHKGRTG